MDRETETKRDQDRERKVLGDIRKCGKKEHVRRDKNKTERNTMTGTGEKTDTGGKRAKQSQGGRKREQDKKKGFGGHEKT